MCTKLRLVYSSCSQLLIMAVCRLDTAEFQKGDLYIVRYRPVQQLLRDKWIALI